MRRFGLLALLLIFSPALFAQSPDGIIAASRTIDYTMAGLPLAFVDGETTTSHIVPPSRPVCTSGQAGTTVPLSSPTPAALKTAAQNCHTAAPNGIVITYTGNIPITATQFWNTFPNTTIRGLGPANSKITLSGSSNILFGTCCTSAGFGTVSAGLSQGSTSITLTTATNTGDLVVNNVAQFQQLDPGWSGTVASPTGAYSDNGAVYPCGDTTVCNSNGSGAGGSKPAHLTQTVTITGVSPNAAACAVTCTVTFSPGLRQAVWSTGQAAILNYQAQSGNNQGVALEDVTLDITGGGANQVQFTATSASWAKGVQVIGSGANHVFFFGQYAKNDLFINNLCFGGNPTTMTSQSDCVGTELDSDNAIVNSGELEGVFYEGGGSSVGLVQLDPYWRDITTQYVQSGDFQHGLDSAYPNFTDIEYPQGNLYADDNTWITHGFTTILRGQLNCSDLPYVIPGNASAAINIGSFSRFANLVADVLGGGSGCTQYQANAGGAGGMFRFDDNNKDPLSQTTALRWLVYDTFTNAVHTCGSSSSPNWTAVCSATGSTCSGGSCVSEIPTTLSGNAVPYQNTVPTATTASLSYFMPSITAHPNGGTGLPYNKVCTVWITFPTSCATFVTPPWPRNGYDVTGGTTKFGTLNGFANDNPMAIAVYNLPIINSYQNSYSITASTWSASCANSGGIACLKLNVTGLPTSFHIMGGFQISGGTCATSGAGTATGTQVYITHSTQSAGTTDSIEYALASDPGNCVATMLWPDVPNFDERVFSLDSAAAGSVTISPVSENFGNVNVGSSSSAIPFTITNSTAGTVTGISMSTGSAQFTISSNTCGGSLTTTSTCTLNVTFTPSGTGAQSATLTTGACSDASCPATAPLSGTGVAVSSISHGLVGTVKIVGTAKVQ